MTTTLNTQLFRTITTEDTRKELEALRSKASDDTITEQLLDAIERGSLQTPIFAAWLGVCKNSNVVEKSLRQKTSVRIRYLGIKQLKNGLESAQWRVLWDELGGTAGLLSVFCDLSVSEIQAICKAIGRSARVGDIDNKRACVTELFEGLHPSAFPDAKSKTTDSRPLTKYYQALVPSCSEDIISRVTAVDEREKWSFVRERELLEQHSDSLGSTALRLVLYNGPPDAKSIERLRLLSTRYPSRTTPECGFSASMAFGLDLLRELTESGSKHIEDSWAVENVIRPLFRRGVRKRISWSRLQELTALTLRYLERHGSAAKTITGVRGDVVHMVALCWSRRSALFEQHLISLLNIVFDRTARVGDFEDLLVGVPQSRRYSLLRLCCQEIMGVDLDIEQDLQNIQGPLSPVVLDQIEAVHALGLFERLRKVRGDVDLVGLGQYSSVLVTTRTPDVYEGDPDIQYLVLLNRNSLHEVAESYATDVLETRKKMTKTSSSREIRAEHAVSTWACANASGSLMLLSETLQWAKTFVRDQLTAVKLFSSYFDETYGLLAGVRTYSTERFLPQDLRQRVERANKIMVDLLQIACSALREPFFKPSDWRDTINVFTRVVQKRIELSASLRGQMGASDEEIYYALWEDTIATLVQAEKLANEEEHEKLGANKLSGLLSDLRGVMDTEVGTYGRATWMFLDNLAKARNELWADLRPSRFPDVLTLPEPFPRGLPVQHLLASRTSDVASLSELAPYVFSRVEATLFIKPEAALEVIVCDDSIRQAIGTFVDSYKHAFSAYVPDACDAQEKVKRFKEVWSHATGPLSDRGMDQEEAVRFWRRHVPSHLQATLSDILPKKEHIPWPVIPRSDHPSETQEWNPLEDQPPHVHIQARELGKAAYIDFSLLAGTGQFSIVSQHRSSPVPQVPAHVETVGSIWGYRRTEAEAEAVALAALLYMDAKYGSTTRMLATPFPSREDVRYPCLFLDENFLSCNLLRISNASAHLSKNIDLVPLPLVREITATLIGKLSSAKNSFELEQASVTLIRAIGQSDKPSLAIDLAIQVIIGQPNTSSWHRLLFHNGFLQHLAASDARNCIGKFAEAIGEKLDAQKRLAQVKAGNTEVDTTTQSLQEGASQGTVALVKITTLKSLAQVLHGSNYIGDEHSLEILSDLAKQVTHIDVRLSILRTLLSKLDANRPELWDRVLAALEPFMQLAGGLHEREPMTDSDWAQAEATMILPKIQLTTLFSWREHSPMLEAILDYYLKLEDTELMDLYLKRILHPTVQILKRETTRWSTLFLRKYASKNVESLADLLPPIPRGITILEQIMTKSCSKPLRLPRSLLDEYMAYMLYRINPPEAIRALNQSLQSDPVVKIRPEFAATWLDLYGGGVENQWVHRLPFTKIANFDEQQDGADEFLITRRLFQKKWLEVFTAFLWADAPIYKQFRVFVSTLTNPYMLGQPWWKSYGRSTVEAMLAYVDSIRTRAWEADPHRNPAVLPDTFIWKLSLLSYPLNSLHHDDPEALEQTCKTFAKELGTLLNSISNSMYHVNLAQIKGRICKGTSLSNTEFDQNLMLSALYLGDISKTMLSWLTTPDLLRVDLAADIILDRKVQDIGDLGPRMQKLLSSWIASENEEVRRTGYRVQEELFDANGEWKGKTRR